MITIPATQSHHDALELEIFRNASSSIVDEIELNLTRTAYSRLIHEYKDYCVALLTPDFRLLTQSRGSIPIFIGDLGGPVADAVAVIGEQRLRPGDVFITNFAEVSGQHLNNVVMAQPIFTEDALVGYAVIRAHWIDVGGIAAGSASWNAQDIYQEGIQYRGLVVARDGEPVPEVLATILCNTRLPEMVRGDFLAQLGGVKLGVRRWHERLSRLWSPAEIADLTAAQWRSSAELARRRLTELPDASVTVSCTLDDSGRPGTAPVSLPITVTIRGDTMEVDLRKIPAQVAAPINAGASGGGASAVRVAFKALLAPLMPADEGLFDPLTVLFADSSIVSASRNAPLGHWNSTMPTLIDLVLRAVGQVSPDRVPAGHHGHMGIASMNGRRADGTMWEHGDTAMGGLGGWAGGDGFSAVKTLIHGDTSCIPCEVVEGRFPIRFHQFEFLPNSAGQGRYRGGWGTIRVLEVLDDVRFNASLDRTVDPPWGLAGGHPATPGEIEVREAETSEWRAVRKVTGLLLPAGSLVRVRAAGGGGWGDPAQRDPRSREADRKAGLVTDE